MRGSELLDKMEHIDPAYIEAADSEPKRKKRLWLKVGAAAACICLLGGGAVSLFAQRQTNTLQSWHTGYLAEDYFKFCGEGGEGESHSTCIDDALLPYEQTRFFSDMREKLEADGVIPVMESHPKFDFMAHYNDDGSLYCMELLWSQRSLEGLENYSSLKVIAGYEKVNIISDCVIWVDENGEVIEPDATVTERDGVQIIATGQENEKKTMTFQSENGWYQISGSWNDDYQSVVSLLDWFWEHPIDFEQFPMDAGDDYTGSTLAQTPDAFAGVLPDFASFGFVEVDSSVSLKNGVPVRFEGHYAAQEGKEQTDSGEHDAAQERTKVHWCVTSEPDVWDLERCIGDLNDLTQEKVKHILENGENKLVFTQNGLLVTIYPDDAETAWMLIESLKGR